MPGRRTGMEDRECGHPAPLQSTKARYQVLRRATVSVASSSTHTSPFSSLRFGCQSVSSTSASPPVRPRTVGGYPHRRWSCLRRCSGPPTSAWRDGSASWWRCPLAPSGSTGAPAGADPSDPPRRRAAACSHRNGPRDRTAVVLERRRTICLRGRYGRRPQGNTPAVRGASATKRGAPISKET